MTAEVCIAGGGPAGMVLGWLLARAGASVVVLEKHRDFLRDFRGDTIHPSVLELMVELGCDQAFLERPHTRVDKIGVEIERRYYPVADFSKLSVTHPFVAFMPQWDFLDFVREHAELDGGGRFTLQMECEVNELVQSDGAVRGVMATSNGAPMHVEAPLTVAADGRASRLRDLAGLPAVDLGAPMDVLWFKLEMVPHEGDQPLIRVRHGAGLVLIDRGDYYQCGYIVAKGRADTLREQDIGVLRADVAELAPNLAPVVDRLAGWSEVSTLQVQVNRLTRWHKPGLLCIGDAAHAMSPVGGIGINIAIQDAVAAARILARPLIAGRLTEQHLAAVQTRREKPTRRTQAIQVAVQRQLIARFLHSQGTVKAPLALRLLRRLPWLRRLPARFIGLGVQLERLSES